MNNHNRIWTLKIFLVINLLLFNVTIVYADEHEESVKLTICGSGSSCGASCSVDLGVPSAGCAAATGYHDTNWNQLLSDPTSGLVATLEVSGPGETPYGVVYNPGSPGYTGDGLRSDIEVVYYNAGDPIEGMDELNLATPGEFPIDGFYYITPDTCGDSDGCDWNFVSMGYTESIEEFENLDFCSSVRVILVSCICKGSVMFCSKAS